MGRGAIVGIEPRAYILLLVHYHSTICPRSVCRFYSANRFESLKCFASAPPSVFSASRESLEVAMSSIKYLDVAGADAVAIRNARGQHLVEFCGADARAPEIRTILPKLKWDMTPGGNLTLPWGDFMQLAMIIATMEAVSYTHLTLPTICSV